MFKHSENVCEEEKLETEHLQWAESQITPIQMLNGLL